MPQHPSNSALKQRLLDRTARGELWHREGDAGVRCYACAHRCFIPRGFDGICKVRSNVDGELRVPWGYVGGLQVDPIEKKPFFHAYPGTDALSFGMLGCDFRCRYCQNWISSQTLRDPDSFARPQDITAEELVSIGEEHRVSVVTSTYNEPLITSEWGMHVFRLARERGFSTAYVSNGNATAEVLEYIRPHVDLYKIDLKGFSDKGYRELGGVLSHVLDTIERVYRMGMWLEIVTLLVPGCNDDPAEVRDLVRFLKGVSPSVPWHVTAFHGDYKMRDRGNTSVATLLRAAEIGREEGLEFVYAGNRHGMVGDWESTYCPRCNSRLIHRRGFRVQENRLKDGNCPDCGHALPGVWKPPRSQEHDESSRGQ